MIPESGVLNHACSVVDRVCHFILEALPYIGLVLIGHTATSLDHHAGDWQWGTYLLSCASTVVLGIAIYCVVSASSVPPMWGYAMAVLAGRNTKETLDMFSRDLLEWVKRGTGK